MKCLALDLGTNTGIAYGSLGNLNPTMARTDVWATKKEVSEMRRTRMDRRRDRRLTRFFETLERINKVLAPELVVFEDVQFQSFTLQTQLWSSFRTAVWLAFPGQIIECVPTGTLKLFATRHGGATKEMMEKALINKIGIEEFNSHDNLDDNAVDAIWLWFWAKQNLSRIPKNTD